MTVRIYLLPLDATPDPDTGRVIRRPKYVMDLGIGYTVMDYGKRPVCLCRCDVTNAQHTALVANADVSAFPANLDATVAAGQLSTVTAAMDGFRIPSQWVTTGMAYRTVLRGIAQLFQFAQRLHGLFDDDPAPDGVTMGTLISDLPASLRQNLNATATSFGFDTSGVTGGMTLRQALRTIAAQWQGPIQLKGDTL